LRSGSHGWTRSRSVNNRLEVLPLRNLKFEFATWAE
jgi:hypothetical protein